MGSRLEASPQSTVNGLQPGVNLLLSFCCFDTLGECGTIGTSKVVAESRSFVTAVYQASAGFPNTERFGLTNQLRRAALSIGSNIVEGSARSSRAEFARFLDIAVASSAECQFQLEVAADLGFLQPTVADELVQQAEMIRRMTSKLKRRVLENEA